MRRKFIRIVGEDFYRGVLSRLLQDGAVTLDASILVLAGGTRDKENFLHLGFEKVTISNVDPRMDADSFAPYSWVYRDAENIDLEDGSVDHVVVHAGLHHCYSPHRALLEAYRVARRGVLIYDGRDNAITRLGTRLGFGEHYELAAVYNNGFIHGGVANSEIPNFVYRWTEQEVFKTIASNDPLATPDLAFFYGLEPPFRRLANLKNRLFYLILRYGYAVLFAMFFLQYRQFGNRFAFYVKKPEYPRDLHPWLALQDQKVVLNREYLADLFRRPASVQDEKSR